MHTDNLFIYNVAIKISALLLARYKGNGSTFEQIIRVLKEVSSHNILHDEPKACMSQRCIKLYSYGPKYTYNSSFKLYGYQKNTSNVNNAHYFIKHAKLGIHRYPYDTWGGILRSPACLQFITFELKFYHIFVLLWPMQRVVLFADHMGKTLKINSIGHYTVYVWCVLYIKAKDCWKDFTNIDLK